MTDATVSLVLGDFYLHGGESDEWTVDVIADGVDWGSPAGVDAAVQTLLQNSTLVTRERYDNREVTFKVRIRAADGVILAAAEAALFAELGKPNEMVWTPPAAYSPPTVFRVVMSDMEPDVDDLAELRCERTYSLHFVCEAFNRSVDEIVTEAEFQPVDGGGDPVAPIDTLVDDCSSSTGWSAVGAGQSVVASGGVLNSDPASESPMLCRSGTVSMTGTDILVIDAKFGGKLSTVVPRVALDASPAKSPFAYGPSPYSSQGYTRYYYKCTASSFSTLSVGSFGREDSPGRLWLQEIRRQNTPPLSGTLRQKFFTVDVAGSAPSDGTLEVYHDSDALGVVMLYTWPQKGGQGFTPALRQFITTSGAATSDATLVSGARNSVTTSATNFAIPITQVAPGTYEFGAWLRRTATGTDYLRCDFGTKIGSTSVEFTSFDAPITFPTANTWAYHPLGRVQLPVNQTLPDSSAMLVVSLYPAPSTTGSIDLDEAHLFNVESGALTVVDADTSTRVWIRSATLDWPAPSVLRGTLADGTDAFGAGTSVSSWGTHRASPPAINVFAVTRTALDAGVVFTQTPAWHTNAGQ